MSSKLLGSNSIQTLKKSADFDRTFKSGSQVRGPHWLLARVCANVLSITRIGWTVPKYVGSAVVRNRIKRWIRTKMKDLVKSHNVESKDINIVFRKKEANFYIDLSRKEFDDGLEKLFRNISQ